MKKNIIIYMTLLLSFVFIITGCSTKKETSDKQSAAAKQQVSENQSAIMTVDLTGGYSVEFATGAAYFYKGDTLDESETIAHAYVIDKTSFEEETSYFENNDDLEGDYKKLKDGTYSYKTESNAEYFFSTNDNLYMKVVVQKDFLSEADSIYTRFSANADE